MVDQNLVNSVKASLSQGITKEQIYQQLLAQGQSLQQIQDIFDLAGLETKKAESQARTISIVVVIGAVLVGAGIFSFIASNWEYFSKPIKISIILVSMILSYVAGWYIREVKQLYKTGMALILLGTIIYGSGIFLIAQIFNVRANWPDGFILWMLGCVVLALAIDFSSLLYPAAILGIIAVIGNPFTIFDTFGGYNPLLLTSTLLLVLTSFTCFWVARSYKKKISPEQNEIY